MRFTRSDTLLLVIDLQQRLAPAIAGHEDIVRRTQVLLDAAALFGVPRLATEHCPQNIGALLEPIRSRLADDEVFVKTSFGAADHPQFVERVQASGRRRIAVTGMEAHVCVLQTALGLLAAGFQVGIVADAAGSRAVRAAERDWALARMQQAGCELLGTETLLYEWTASPLDPAFRDVLKVVKTL